MTSVHLLAETRSCSRHTALWVTPVDNKTGGDPNNTLVKKFSDYLQQCSLEREKRKSGKLKGTCQ